MSSNPGVPCEQVFQLGVLISCLASPHLAPVSFDEPICPCPGQRLSRVNGEPSMLLLALRCGGRSGFPAAPYMVQPCLCSIWP